MERKWISKTELSLELFRIFLYFFGIEEWLETLLGDKIGQNPELISPKDMYKEKHFV